MPVREVYHEVLGPPCLLGSERLLPKFSFESTFQRTWTYAQILFSNCQILFDCKDLNLDQEFACQVKS